MVTLKLSMNIKVHENGKGNNSEDNYTVVISKEQNILHAESHILVAPTFCFWKLRHRLANLINIVIGENNFRKIRLREISIVGKSLFFPHCKSFLRI
jgi:hypothetical protein